MAPEVLMEMAPDGRADISLWELFSTKFIGPHPFQAASF